METFINLCVQFQLIKIQLKCRAVLLFRLNFTTYTHSLGFSFIDSFQQKRQRRHRNQFLSLSRSRHKYRQHSINYYCVCVRRRRRRIRISTENPLTTKGYPNQIWWVLGMTVLLPSADAAAECIDRLILINCSLEIETFTCWFLGLFLKVDQWPIYLRDISSRRPHVRNFQSLVPFHFQFHHDKELSRSKCCFKAINELHSLRALCICKYYRDDHDDDDDGCANWIYFDKCKHFKYVLIATPHSLSENFFTIGILIRSSPRDAIP